MAEIEIKPNDKWEDRSRCYKVVILAIGGGYVMAKRRGDHPFCEEINIFIKKFRPATRILPPNS